MDDMKFGSSGSSIFLVHVAWVYMVVLVVFFL